MHIYDPARFSFAPSTRVTPTRAAVPQYRMLQSRIGTTRVVIVTPRNYGVDNRATVDGITDFGADARGVAVLHPSVTDAELKKLHDGGIRGIRFSLGDPANCRGVSWRMLDSTCCVASRVFKILFAEWFLASARRASMNSEAFHFQLGNVSCSAIKDD